MEQRPRSAFDPSGMAARLQTDKQLIPRLAYMRPGSASELSCKQPDFCKYSTPMATAQRALVRPQSAMRPPVVGFGRAAPTFEDHHVLPVQGGHATYVSITKRKPGMVNPDDPSTHPRTQSFKPHAHITGWRAMPQGRMDGKDMGGRIGRSRGLGGNPVAWRSEAPARYGQSEYLRSYQERSSKVRAITL